MSEKALDFSQTSCSVKTEIEAPLVTEKSHPTASIEQNQKTICLTISQQKLLDQLFDTGLTKTDLIEFLSFAGGKDSDSTSRDKPARHDIVKNDVDSLKHVGVSAFPSVVSAFTQTESTENFKKPR